MAGRIRLAVADPANAAATWLNRSDWGRRGADHVLAPRPGASLRFGGGVCSGLLIVLICIAGRDRVRSRAGHEFIPMERILHCAEGLAVGLRAVLAVNTPHFRYGKDDADDNHDGNGALPREAVFTAGLLIPLW